AASSSTTHSSLFFFSSPSNYSDLHSFPTRRSSDLFLYTNPTINIIFYKLLVVLIGNFPFSPFCPCLSNFLRLWQTSNRCCWKQWQLKSFFLFFNTFCKCCISRCLCSR